MAVCGLDYRYIIGLEIDLIRFYHHIILEDLRQSPFEADLMDCLKKVKDGYSKYVLKNGLTDTSFSRAGMRSSYIFLNTPCFSSCVASHFLNLIRDHSVLLNAVTEQSSLAICCLGGGPGGEVMAIVKSLELVLKLFHRTSKPVTVNATIVDKDPGWSNVSRKVTQNWWKCADYSIVKLKLSFKQADLTQPLSEDVQDTLRKSDVVTMVKLVSAVYGTEGRAKISEMLKGVIHPMKKDGILFYLNASRFSCIEILNNVISRSVKMATIYGPLHYDVYQLSDPSKDVCYDLYHRFYGMESPTFHCQSHVIAWHKFET